MPEEVILLTPPGAAPSLRLFGDAVGKVGRLARVSEVSKEILN